ncbi:MAG: glycosyltransferase family 8 protein [Methanomicrobia archaeon]|nr:glycosyltransferase family 8 protein [Methanomicrobia archaeon]
MSRKQIPIFFACDDNYIPFLGVAISTLKEKASRDYDYRIIVLNEGLRKENQERISRLSDVNFHIEYHNISTTINKLREALSLRLRDYYSVAIYYRMFIPTLYPELDKAIYLDGDIVVLGDISEFYNTNVEGKLVAAINDRLVLDTPEFVRYVEQGVGIKATEYFNSGVLVMNLKEFRQQNIQGQFVELLLKHNFDSVCPDQDYLNVLCRHAKVLVPICWNKMPLPDKTFDVTTLKLCHYNSFEKPWRHDGVLFGEIFWEKAKNTEFYTELRAMRDAVTEKDSELEAKAIKGLVGNAVRISNQKENTFKSVLKL